MLCRVKRKDKLRQEPDLRIIDEVTSALDEPAAASVLQGLALFRKKTRMLVIISHRPVTIL
jgi:ABC-type bacteriocin/lantibiotic exporter with double-glycine peptidase domain